MLGFILWMVLLVKALFLILVAVTLFAIITGICFSFMGWLFSNPVKGESDDEER